MVSVPGFCLKALSNIICVPSSSSGTPPKTLLAFSSASLVHSSYVASQDLPEMLQPQKEEEEGFLPHLLLLESIDLLEKVDRKYKKKKQQQQKQQRLRQFNDLWVRLEKR